MNTTTPTYGERLKTVPNSKIITPSGGYIHPQRSPVWTRAWRQQLHPITVSRTSLRPQPHRYLLLPRLERRSRRFSPGSARLPVPVLMLPIHHLLLRVSTPPQYHTPSLPRPLAAGLPCIVVITGDTLDITPPYNSTPGDNILKRQIVITGVCFLACYTVLRVLAALKYILPILPATCEYDA